MIKMLVIADDFTGALDTGAQFAGKGIMTKVIHQKSFGNEHMQHICADVLIIATQTRHLTGEQAYKTVYNIVREAKKIGINYIYKKIDSGLRGNVGKELEAAIDASGEMYLTFIPAFPAMNRITVGGIHYIDGKPIHKSVFAEDLFEPVISSNICDLFKDVTSDIRLYKKADHYERQQQKEIGIFDASTNEDIERITNDLLNSKSMGIMAGCAGFASVLANHLGLETKEINLPIIPQNLLVVCGSINDISRRQIEYAQENGIRRITMTPEQQLESGYLESWDGVKWLEKLKYDCENSPICIIDTGISDRDKVAEYLKKHRISPGQARGIISGTVGKMLKKIWDMGMKSTIMIIGGDTLASFVAQMKCEEIIIVREIEQGTVLSLMKIGDKLQWLISKSGGFGESELLVKISEMIKVKKEGNI